MLLIFILYRHWLVIINIFDIILKYYFSQTRALNKMPWRIFYDDLRLIDEDQAKSLVFFFIKQNIF